MVRENEDTRDESAPEGIPETPAQQDSQDQQAPSSESTEPRKFAGKYSSVEELEKAYQEASSKIGSKGYAEKLGEKVVEATGYSVKDLQDAGYSEDDIVKAIVEYSSTGQQQEMAKVDPRTTIKQTVESAKVDSLQFELEVDRLLRKHPEAEEVSDWIYKMKKHPDFRDKSASDIYAELKPVLKRAEKAVQETHAKKEQASMSISNQTTTEPKGWEKAAERFKRSGHIDDAADLIYKKLFGKSGS